MTAWNGSWLLNLFFSSGKGLQTSKGKLVYQTSDGQGAVIETRRDKNGTISLYEERARTPSTESDECENYLAGVEPAIGHDVICSYGKGRIFGIRSAEKMVVVRLSSWRLAGSSRVTCYLSTSAVRVVGIKKLYEMSVQEKLEYARAVKGQAYNEFISKDYLAACQTYARAIEAMRCRDDDSLMDASFYSDDALSVSSSTSGSSSATKGTDLVLLMITCSNNAATCCSVIKKWDDAASFARQALALIAGLEAKRGNRMHKVLNKAFFTDAKIFGEWRVRGLLISARAAWGKHNAKGVIDITRSARQVIAFYTDAEYIEKYPQSSESAQNLLLDEKAFRRLHKKAKRLLKAEPEVPLELQLALERISESSVDSNFEEEDATQDDGSSVTTESRSVIRRMLGSFTYSPILKSSGSVPTISFPSTVPRMITEASSDVPEESDKDNSAIAWNRVTTAMPTIALMGGIGLVAALAVNGALYLKKRH
jgi:hypothetical protein